MTHYNVLRWVATLLLSLVFSGTTFAYPIDQNQSNAIEACQKNKAELITNGQIITIDCRLEFFIPKTSDYDGQYYLGYRGYSSLYGWVDQAFGFAFWLPGPDDAKDENSRGCPPESCNRGDPINPTNGNKYETVVEYAGSGPYPLTFAWTYNSNGSGILASTDSVAIGSHRSHTYQRSVQIVAGANAGLPETWAYVARPDGNVEKYVQAGSAWTPEADNENMLVSLLDGQSQIIGWEHHLSSGDMETYGSDGKLTRVTNRAGLSHNVGYDSLGRLATVTDSLSRTLIFSYNSLNQISQVSFPDGRYVDFAYTLANLSAVKHSDQTSVQYLYGESGYVDADNDIFASYALTGVIDERGIRYSSTTYDSGHHAISTWLAGNIDRFDLTYQWTGTTTLIPEAAVTGPLGKVETFNNIATFGQPHVSGLADSCPGCTSKTMAYTYDGNGRRDLTTDFTGAVTDSDYDSNGLLTQLIRAKGTPQEQTETRTWNTTLRVPTQIDRPGQRQTFTYNTRGQALTMTVTDPATSVSRTTTYTYCEQANINAGTCPLLGLITKIDGPRSDVVDKTTFTYYASDDPSCVSAPTTCPHRKGDLWKTTNAAGQISKIQTYDGAGRVLSIKDANNIVTDLEYSPRGWLTARKVRGTNNGSEVDDAITRLTYDAVGQVTKVTQPDGAFISFTYDDAHRLTDLSDALGNTIHYTLDNAGNRIAEDTKTPSGTLTHTLSRVYDALSQLQTLADANATPTDFTYDANGATNTITDALGRITDNDVDPLGRVIQVIANTNGSVSDKATTQFQYDARDNLTTVIDPKGLSTVYTYNGLDDLTQLSSPDTGTTTYGVDAAGNRASQLDARGLTTSYSYDLLNRLTAITVPTPAQNRYFDYDTPQADCLSGETFGIGRLAQIRDESGSTRSCYDRFGHLVRSVQTVTGGPTLTIGATYNAADRLVAMTYPSGAIVTYVRNAAGQITGVDAKPTAGAAQINLVSNVITRPFGPVTSLTFGNGRQLSKTFDLNVGIDKVSDSVTTGLSEDFSLNANGNVTGLAERTNATNTANRTISYDGLDRLTALKNGSNTVQGFTYDATGNRLSQTLSGTTTNNTYPATSHRLTQVGTQNRTYDAVGNTATAGTPAFVYDNNNRLSQYKANGSTITRTYLTNGKGERVAKRDPVTSANDRYYTYDPMGHLLGEYTANGARTQEFVWLDDTLIAILSDHDGSTYQFVETDHLGTPRAVIHPSSNAIIWRWNLSNTAFGEHAPTQDPDGNSLTYTVNLRYPGQWYDSESKLNYNYFRFYDASTGRYTQSDPIGLKAGFSTYGYVGGNPLTSTDPLGLVEWTGTFHIRSLVVGVGGAFASFDLTSECINSKKFNAEVTVVGPAGGAGLKFLLGGDVSGNISFQDHASAVDPSNIEGWAGIFSVGVQVGSLGLGYTKIRLGNAFSRGTGDEAGLDVGASLVVGSSTITGGKGWIDCDCE